MALIYKLLLHGTSKIFTAGLFHQQQPHSEEEASCAH